MFLTLILAVIPSQLGVNFLRYQLWINKNFSFNTQLLEDAVEQFVLFLNGNGLFPSQGLFFYSVTFLKDCIAIWRVLILNVKFYSKW